MKRGLYSFVLAFVVLCYPLPFLNADTFTAVNYGEASADETDAFNRINAFRADPRNELYEMFVDQGYGGSKAVFDALLNGQTSHTAGWWVSNFGSNLATNSMDFFGTVPSTLNGQFAALPAGPLPAYTWSDNLGWASHQYSVWVENDAGATSNPHAVAGAPGFAARFSDAGVNWTGIGENIAANWIFDTELMHMGFAVDWGPGVDGIQSPPGHRNSMLSTSYDHLGIGIVDAGWDSERITQVQHFATQFSTDPIVYGYVTDEMTGNELSGVLVNVYDAGNNLLGTATTDARGAYTIQYTGGTPDYTTYAVSGAPAVTGSGLGNSGSNYFLDAALSQDTLVLGDANDDGVFNNSDIASFVLALTNLVAYQAMFPGVDPDVVLDMNDDGSFDNFDIAAFVAALTGDGKK